MSKWFREKTRERKDNLTARSGGGRWEGRTRVLLRKVGDACKRRTINQNPLSCRSVSLKSGQTDRSRPPPRPALLHPLSPLTRARIPILNADISRHAQSRMRDTYRLACQGCEIYGYRESSRRAIVRARSCKFRRKQRERRMAGHVPAGAKFARIDSWAPYRTR